MGGYLPGFRYACRVFQDEKIVTRASAPSPRDVVDQIERQVLALDLSGPLRIEWKMTGRKWTPTRPPWANRKDSGT